MCRAANTDAVNARRDTRPESVSPSLCPVWGCADALNFTELRHASDMRFLTGSNAFHALKTGARIQQMLPSAACDLFLL
jgi:hypothetical protein